jgi:multiple antibiotic resistance protein
MFFPVDVVVIATIFIKLFAVLNPVGAVPRFLVLTAGKKPAERSKLVDVAGLAILVLMAIFALFGNAMLDALNITLESLMFGGGILLMVLAVDMLSGIQRSKEAVEDESVALVPIATPLLVGPGTMTTVIVMSVTYGFINTLGAVAVVSIVTWLLLRSANLVHRIVGDNGVKAISRLMAVVLAAVAANFIHKALLAWGIAAV